MKARKVAGRLGVSFPLLFDDTQQIAEAYSLESMPYTVLLDRHGQVSYIHQGYKPGDENKYIDQLTKLLGKK